MGLFSKKKIYCIEWHSVWEVHRREYVRAKDEAHAWKIIKRKNGGIAAYCEKIYEVIPNKPEII